MARWISRVLQNPSTACRGQLSHRLLEHFILRKLMSDERGGTSALGRCPFDEALHFTAAADRRFERYRSTVGHKAAIGMFARNER